MLLMHSRQLAALAGLVRLMLAMWRCFRYLFRMLSLPLMLNSK